MGIPKVLLDGNLERLSIMATKYMRFHRSLLLWISCLQSIDFCLNAFWLVGLNIKELDFD